jgi:2,3,4,5-tetrahydropyridine-2-carboxylate N-succinyltransferase
LLDAGKLRVAEPKGDAWQVNEWVKSSCYVFSYPENGNMGSWNFEYHDKMELKDMLLKEFVFSSRSISSLRPYISSG